MPAFSILVPVHNAGFLEETVRSVLAQSCRDFEFILIDDGATDACTTVLSTIDDARIRLIEQPSQGAPAALNHAIAFAAFQQISYRRSQFDSNFHALNLSLQRRLRHGLQLQGKYSWSKSIDDDTIMLRAEYFSDAGFPAVQSCRLNRGPSDFDRRHDVAGNFVWMVPSPSHSMPAGLLRGWELDGTLRAGAGHPFNPTVGFDNARLRPSSADQGQRPTS